MKKVLTVGVFDVIHIGHFRLFERAKSLGDKLIVAVQDGDFILKYKPQAKIVYDTVSRCYMVNSVKYVDEVIVYKAVDDIVKEVDFDIFAKGPDQCHAGFQAAVEWCKANGKEVVELPRTEGISSSMLKQELNV